MKINQLVSLLKEDKIGVIPTDTIYGIVGLALNPQTVEKIYDLRKRVKDKPMIVLISNISDLEEFGIKISDKTKEILKKIWPNPVSIVLPCTSEKFCYLHRGKKSLAFRMPKNKYLQDLLKQVGPLVAPSANIEGQPVSETIKEAREYFGDRVSFYFDKGKIQTEPSTLVEIKNNKVKVLRQGRFEV